MYSHYSWALRPCGGVHCGKNDDGDDVLHPRSDGAHFLMNGGDGAHHQNGDDARRPKSGDDVHHLKNDDGGDGDDDDGDDGVSSSLGWQRRIVPQVRLFLR